MQKWENVALLTMAKKSIKELYWILNAEDDLHTLFQSVCKKWLNGGLMDGQEMRVERKDETINAQLFRCFEGDLSGEDILWILNQVLEEKALLKRDGTKDTSTLPSMKDLADTLKIEARLQEAILEFYKKDKRFAKRFEDCEDWKTLDEILPFEISDMDTCRRVAGGPYISALLARNKKQEDLPYGMEVFLCRKYYDTFGGSDRTRKEPYIIFQSLDRMVKVTPNVDNEAPVIPLVFVDLTRRK